MIWCYTNGHVSPKNSIYLSKHQYLNALKVSCMYEHLSVFGDHLFDIYGPSLVKLYSSIEVHEISISDYSASTYDRCKLLSKLVHWSLL